MCESGWKYPLSFLQIHNFNILKSPDVVGTIAIATDTASSKMLNTMSKVAFLSISNERPKNKGW